MRKARVMAQRAVMKQQVRALETQVIKGAVGLDYFLFFRRQAGKHSLTEAVMGIATLLSRGSA